MEQKKIRMRRLRSSDAIRRLVSDVHLSANDLVYPLFVRHGEGVCEPLETLSGCNTFSPDTIVEEAKNVWELGIPAVLLFGKPRVKDAQGSEAWSEDGAVQQAVRQIKQAVPALCVITDVCLCAYTDHGHCGAIQGEKVDNDLTCELLAKTALSHAQAGADIVAPSDMMDGRVGCIRAALEENGFVDTAIMSYAAKYASAFYGPFRDVADSAPAFGDRRSYQMDPFSAVQAMREIELDIEEGADIVMVKPAMCYLDVIRDASAHSACPVAAYQVSGEYMMMQSAAEQGLLDLTAAMMESLGAIRRAGASIVITYFAKQAAAMLQGK